MANERNNSQRHDQIREAIMHAVAKFIVAESNHQSLITVTDVSLSDDNKRAKILFTVLPVHKEEAALDFLKRKRSECREFLQKEIRGPRVPFLDFAIDLGEKNRQRIEEISKNS